MLTLDYFVVDAFTTEPLAGNPLAVVMNTCALATERMQAIAREFNLSETTFVERRLAEIEQVEGVRVRIFTPREELPFAGHPTLGTAAVLKVHAPEIAHGRYGDSGAQGRAGAGALRGRHNVALPDVFGEMTQRYLEFGAELDAKIVAGLTGLVSMTSIPLCRPKWFQRERPSP